MKHASNAAAIVLAGGRSTRLGRDKASELLLGRPLLQRVVDRVAPLVAEVVIVRAKSQAIPVLACPVPLHIVDDAYPGAGPLGGIYAGLLATTAERSLAVACDMPMLSPLLLGELLRQRPGCDVVLPVTDRPQPLHAVYSRACIPPMRARLEAGDLKLTYFLDAMRVCVIDEATCRHFDPDLHSFLNANTESDLSRAVALLLAAATPPNA
jgi:molybdopterin-guanine dinucleotide biosynthesis protein A